ncbi:MAG: aminomethyl-transferring glycine dehydrogenase subunit GcvPA [Chloroflexota bacterium]
MSMKYLPNTDRDREQMLRAIGVGSVADLFADVPAQVRFKGQLNIPKALSEPELAAHMKRLASKNADAYTCFLGGGAYDHYIPAVVDHVISRSEFYTAYTPYQPEISQGTLQAIFEYQTAICELTGMDVANASVYDGATAVAEAVMMAHATNNKKRVVMARSVHPDYRQTVRTYVAGLGLAVVEADVHDGLTCGASLGEQIDDDTTCVIVQSPNFFGNIEDMAKFAELAHAHGALFVAVVDPISLGLLKAPGHYGADIVCGEGQALGNPMAFGGPYLGFFATKTALVRRMPGRLVGETVDNRGQRGFVLTLQTREQHIRREKATSNICSNEALCALAALVYMSTMGRKGMKEVAELSAAKAHYARERIANIDGWSAAFTAPFFKEFVVKAPVNGDVVQKHLLSKKMLGGTDLGRWYPELKNHLLFAVTEKRSRGEIDALVAALEEVR